MTTTITTTNTTTTDMDVVLTNIALHLFPKFFGTLFSNVLKTFTHSKGSAG
jgi:hypothetical protein